MHNEKSLSPVARIAFSLAGSACLFFTLIPALIYRIVNSGVIVLFLAGCALLLLAFRWGKIRIRLRHALCILMGAGMLFAAVCSAMMAKQAYFSPPPTDTVPVIVLGGKVNGTQPSLMLIRRLLAAESYLNDKPGAVCVVSGGQGPDEMLPEAQAMAQWLEARGVPSNRILREDSSKNTEENLSFSAAMLDYPGEVVIATDGFHQLRASIYADMLGIKAYSLPAKTPWGLLPSYWVREWLGLPVAWLKSWGVL